MEFRKIRLFWISILISCLFTLQGCAGKQESAVTVSIPADNTVSPELDSFSKNEIAALKSTDQIDRNVPKEAIGDIAREYRHYLRKGRNNMCALSKQSEQYLAYARSVFRKKGMPEDLANLAIIESGYKPSAVSSAGAAGAWQFMPETGKNYGLTQDLWEDERLDPYRATEAAADYLQKLYNDFGDWPTAIAAYNAGEGKILRAKAQSGGKDFFEVKARNHVLDEKNQLREETQNYVPRFLAVTKIMRNLEDLGFEPIDPEHADTVFRYDAKPGTDLKALSKACNMSWDEFKAINQHHKRTITCTDRKTYVYVPAKAQKQASKFLCTTDAPSYAGWKFVKVAKGMDSLEKISRHAKVPLERLQAANPGLGKLKIGQTILAPGQLKLEKIKELPEINNSMQAAKNGATHKIAPKETLYSIAKKYQLDVKQLMACNNIDNPGKIHTGQILKLPGSGPVKGASQGKIGKKPRQTYVVQSKDNLWRIARKHNLSVEELKMLNNIDEKRLQPGLRLIVEK